MNDSSIRIMDAATRERKKRQRELFLAFLGIIAIGASTWIELKYFGVNSYLFLGLFNLNIILLLLVLFLVLRNIFKLLVERKRKVLGYRLRSRLVLIFMSLSIIPTLLMFIVAVRFVQTSVDYWFKAQVESSMQQALEVGQAFYNTAKEDLEYKSDAILKTIREERFLWGGPGMNKFLAKKWHEYDLSLIGVVSPGLNKQNWHESEEWDKQWSLVDGKIPWKELKKNPEYWTGLWPSQKGDLVLGVNPVDKGESGFLILGSTLEQDVLAKLDGIVRGVEEYKQLKTLKYPLKVALYTILGIMTLLIILGSIWFGFKVAKEISAPVQALAAGTQRIARGDLDVRLEDQSDDELGLLVSSFNAMAGDLQEMQTSLTRANEVLARQNRELESRGEYMQAVLDNITAGVISLDTKGRISTVNKAAEYLLGVEADRIIGYSPTDLLRVEYGQIIKEMYTQLTEIPGSRWQKQLDMEIGGKMVKLLVNALVLHPEHGGDGGIVAVFEDVTELEKMQRLAAWREVARRIAHEIKNPLTPIKLSAQRLQKKFSSKADDPVFEQCTQLIVRQVENLQEMVSEFSTFAKLPELKPRFDYLAPLLEELVEEFSQSHSNIKWSIEFNNAIPGFNFDREAIKRVFMNLFLNAAEALNDSPEPGNIHVRVFHDRSVQKVTIEVMDNGPGLSADERSRIFEPYYSRKRIGTGLGLTIVKSIISDHHGYVRVRPNDPRGSIFVVELPMTG